MPSAISGASAIVSAVALIPARAGSKRVPNKNIRELAGHPLLAYTIAAAKGSGVFERVIVSSESAEYGAIAREYGAEWLCRPHRYAHDLSPDFDWVASAYREGIIGQVFSLLRPTSPFRQPETIRRAWAQFQAEGWWADSLRAMEPCRQHPGKMWVIEPDGWANPLLSEDYWGMPWPHSRPTQTLPPVYVQNASLEIAWTRVLDQGSISGTNISPFLTEGYEGFDINNEHDWTLAEHLIRSGEARLPCL